MCTRVSTTTITTFLSTEHDWAWWLIHGTLAICSITLALLVTAMLVRAVKGQH